MLANLFLKENETAASPAARGRIGKFSGGLGIALNTLLAAGKIAAGILAGAVSVVADGLNNLTDCGSNVVSIIGFKMSEKPADKEHPFGHQRAESLSALIIAVIVLVVAAELAIQSAETILSPAETQVSLLTAIVLAASVAVKLFMFFFNRALAKEIGSEALKATAADSISDAAATSAVLLSLLISKWAQIELDGWMGIAVAVFIAFSGIGILKETVSNLLGKAADAETIAAIKQKICAAEGVHGVHDLVIHDYGRSKLFATVHVEVDANMPIMAAHDLADALEKQIGNFKLAFDDLVIVDACHMALGQFLKAVEFGSVFASFAVCPCRADQCVDFLDGIIRLEVGFQIGVRGGEKFALIFQLPAGGECLQCGFLIRGQGENHCGRQSQKYDFQAHRLFFLSQIVCFIPDDEVS